MPKRASREGSIRQRSDGRWEYRFYHGTDKDGKPKRYSHYFKRQDDALKKKQEIEAQIVGGSFVEPNRMTVEQWLVLWFDNYFKETRRASTVSVYDVVINTYLIPEIGKTKLQKLRPDHIQAMISAQINGGLAPATTKKTITVLKAALKQACENELIPKNPADKVKLPKLEQKEIEFLTIEEQRALLEVLPDNDNGRALRFILCTGLRVSELCGLRWRDIQKDYFTVKQGIIRTKAYVGERRTEFTSAPPKSKAGQRNIPLTDTAKAILEEQRREYRTNKLKAGALWQDGDLAFCTTIGTPKDPANLRRTLRRCLTEASLQQRGLHALRHTFATNALHSGMDPRTLSEIIGHSNVAFTLQTYVHSDMETKIKSMKALDSFL